MEIIKKKKEQYNETKRKWYLKNVEKQRLRGKIYREKNKDAIRAKNKLKPHNPERARRSFLKSKYKITQDIYNSMILSQNNKCLICSELFENKIVHIDHCHTLNVVRGLLCGQCNMPLELMKDNKENILAMYNYINNFTLRQL